MLLDAIIALVSVLVGTFAGWFLTERSTSRRERPKLCFQMTATPEAELTEKELRTKTSASEHGIEIFNVGKIPFILERFSLYDSGKLLVDCFMDEANRVVLPSQNVVYTLMEQDADALQHHCNQHRFEQCNVIAYSVDGKIFKGRLKTPLFALQADFHDSMGIVREEK